MTPQHSVTILLFPRQQDEFLYTAPATPPSLSSLPLPRHKPNLRDCVVETTTPGRKDSYQFHGKNVVFNISFKIFPTLLVAVFKRIAHAQNSTRYDITLLLEIMNLHKTLITGKQYCSSLDKKFATNICNMPVLIHYKFAENHLVYSLTSKRQPTRVKSIVYRLKGGKLGKNEKRPVADK